MVLQHLQTWALEKEKQDWIYRRQKGNKSYMKLPCMIQPLFIINSLNIICCYLHYHNVILKTVLCMEH